MNGSTIDLILHARLDLLEQVLDEVTDIRQAMEDQERRLQVIDDFLKPRGRLHRQRVDVLDKVGTAITRIKSLAETDADEDTRRALESLRAAEPMVDQLSELRRNVYQEFCGLKEWSVAALDSSQLDIAQRLYTDSLLAIKKSEHPWETYEKQLRSRGEQLYGAYLELLGSIAVRGLGIVDDLVSDRKALLELLLTPLASTHNRPRLSVDNLLTRSKHVQLGYLHWSLWALPLIGREAGLYLMAERAFDTGIAEHQQVVCADTYAAYTLGTSYVAAALFLELDPDGVQEGVAASDPMRAELLLDLLPELASPPQREVVTKHRDLLRTAWEHARQAIGAPAILANPEDLAITRMFLAELRTDFPEVAYDLSGLATRAVEAEQLFGGQDIAGIGTTRDVLVAMWWSRVAHPTACKTIDERARAAMAGSGGTLGLGPARTPVTGRKRHDRPMV